MDKGRRPKGSGTIYERSDGSFCGQYTMAVSSYSGEKKKRITVYGKTKTETYKKLEQKKKEITKSGKNAGGDMLLSTWMKDWMEHWMKNSVRKKTWESYEGLIRLHISPAIGMYALNQLTPTIIQKLYTSKLESENGKSLSRRTVRYIHSVLSKALKQAVLVKYLAENPAGGTSPPKQIHNEHTTPTFDQIS